MEAPRPDDEPERLAALREHHILDTAPDEKFDDLVRLAAHVCGVPIAAVSLIDEHRQWFKAIVGLDVTETLREAAFCAHTILHPNLLIVPDAQADPRFADNPLVTGDPHIRFYAGAPLMTDDGHALGSLCVIDRIPKHLTPDQEETLRLLARQAARHLRAVRRTAEREKLIQEKEHLLAEKECLAAIIDSSEDAIYGKTLDGTVTSWNGGAARLYGYSADEIIGRHVDILALPERHGEIEDILAAVRRGETVASEETVRVTKAGQRVHVSLQVSSVRDAGGDIIGASVIARDVTARVQSEAERLRLVAIVETSSEAIYSKTLDGRITSWNPGAECLYGYAAAEIIGRHVNLLVPAERQGEVQDIMAAVRGGVRVVPLETVRLTKTGTRVDVSLHVSPVLDAEGRVIGASMIARDITARKQAEDALTESAARLRRLTDAAFEGVVTVQDGLIVEVSQAWATLFGYETPAALIGMTAITMVAPESLALVVQKIAEGSEEPYEATLLRRDGTTFQAELRGRLIHLDGRPARITAIRDITARKAMEAALLESKLALQKSQVFLQAVADSSTHMLYVFDLDTHSTVYTNTGLGKFWGYAPDQIQAMGRELLPTVIHRDDLRFVKSHFRDFAGVADGEIVEFEARYLHADGEWRWMWVRETVFNRRKNGSPRQIMGTAQDITERKRAEALLAESGKRLTLATKSAQIGIWDWDVAANRMLWDTQMYALYGIREQDFSGAYDAWQNGLHPEDLARAEAEVLAAIKGEKEFHTQFRVVWPNGEIRHIEAHAVVEQASDGSSQRMIGVNWDITERRRMESALVESEARFRTSIDAMEEGMALQGADGAILMCNESAERILGLTADQMAGRTSLDPRWRAIHEDGTDFPGDQHPAMVALREGTPQRNVVMGIHKPSGELTWVNINAVPLLPEGQEHPGKKIALHGVVVTFSDITERKHQEAALRESHSALQESQDRLTEAQRVAKMGSWEYDLGSGRITWSEELFRLFGLEPAAEAPDYKTAMALYHPEDASMLNSLVTRAALQGISYALDLRGAPDLLLGGASRWYHTIGAAIKDDSGRTVRLTGILADITDRKRAEAAQQEYAERLAQSQAVLRAVLESAPVILYAADAEGTITLSEGTGLAALGLRPGEVVGRSVHEFSVGDPEIEAYTRRALAGEAASYDAHVYDLCLHTELRPVRDVSDTVTGIIGVCFDVTERVASEERFRVLFEQSSDAHLLFGEEGIIDCNPAAVALLRCSDITEVLSLHPAVLSPEFQPDGRRSDEKCIEMDALAREHGSHRFEWTHRKMDGEDFPVEVTLTPVTLGSRPVLLVVWHDLTERKQAEEQVKDYAVLLEFQMNALEKSNAELEEVNAQLEDLATTDGLTGLHNHRAFQERLAEEVSRAARYGTPLSLVLLDVDSFKSYNDTHGHPAGDAVLRDVGSILQSCARDTDMVARYGGEEFVLILPQTDLDGAAAFAERLRAAVERHPWPVRAVTGSFGVAGLHLMEESGAELVVRADAALYRSKTGGRNRVTCDGADGPMPTLPKQSAPTEFESEKHTEAVLLSDLNGTFLHVNGRACELLGYTEAALVGKSGIELIHPDDLAREGWRMDDVAAGQVVVTKRRVRCQDGTWLRTEMRTRRLADGRAECVLQASAAVEWEQYRLDRNRLLQDSGEGFSMLDALVAAVDNKDRYTRRHSEDVLAYALMIAQELGLDAAAQDTVAAAALLHDVGKIGVPDVILRKPGPLTQGELEAVKRHPQMGAAMVSTVPELSGTLGAVRHHHERWDGGGYPFGLRGEEIPKLARLMAVADAFSAMTTERPYRAGMPPDTALAVLDAGAGTQWDPHCVSAFRRAYTRCAEPVTTPL